MSRKRRRGRSSGGKGSAQKPRTPVPAAAEGAAADSGPAVAEEAEERAVREVDEEFDRRLDELQAVILGGPRIHTRDELAELSGVPLEVSRELWRALGFADVGNERAFTAADHAALNRLLRLVEAGHVTHDLAVDIVRSLGQTTARLAEWQTEALGRQLVERGDLDLRDGLKPDGIALIGQDLKFILPALEDMLVYAWRRQLAAVAARRIAEVEYVDTDRQATASVGFADLVRFTRLSRQLEDDDLAALVQKFESVSSDVVAATGARLVKTLGDEVLFVADDPVHAAETALQLHEIHSRDRQVPQMRIGIATGDVITRMGDIFGSTVNLASRLTAMARRGSTLVDADSAHALAGVGGYHTRALAPRPVRGLGLVRAFVLRRG